MMLPFTRTRELESQIDEFLDIVIKGVLAQKQAITCYLKCDLEEFATHVSVVSKLENQADDIRKRTETTLYAQALIPESRGDVLALLENTDNVIDTAKKVLQRFEVERPVIPAEYHDTILMLVDSCAHAVDNLVGAARAFFRDTGAVRDYINKVDYYEKEADRAGLKLKRQIFGSNIELYSKMHLRFFVDQIESLSDIAENVAERLAIASIKRSL
ncbi:MAG: DUF47 family protein [Pseudomonadota bacterium]